MRYSFKQETIMHVFPNGFPFGFTDQEKKDLFVQHGGDPQKWEAFKQDAAYNRWKIQRTNVPGQFRRSGLAPTP